MQHAVSRRPRAKRRREHKVRVGRHLSATCTPRKFPAEENTLHSPKYQTGPSHTYERVYKKTGSSGALSTFSHRRRTQLSREFDAMFFIESAPPVQETRQLGQPSPSSQHKTSTIHTPKYQTNRATPYARKVYKKMGSEGALSTFSNRKSIHLSQEFSAMFCIKSVPPLRKTTELCEGR